MNAPHDSTPDGMTALFGEVLSCLAKLVRGEIALARAEAESKLRSALRAVIWIAVAAVLGIAAVTVLAGASIAGLVALGLPPVAASGIVGLGLALAAYGCARRGLYLLSPAQLMPSRSLTNMGQDLATLKTMVKSDAKL
jgi:Putative Actinobacterial Holin-X, holin superfamily III